MPLSAKEILAVQDVKTVEVQVPEWGTDATVLVGTMSALRRAEMFAWIDTLGTEVESSDEDVPYTCDSPSDDSAPTKQYSKADDMRVLLRWCAECILDPKTKKPAFTSEQVEQIGGLHDERPLLRIYNAAVTLNAGTQEEREALEKNSGGTCDGDSGSG
jgi:hypothetical protein